jgi:hypothetical protein
MIKSIKQLKAEQNRIKKEAEILEKKIKNNWDSLKLYLQPEQIAKDTFNAIMNHKTAENLKSDSVLKSTFTYGVTVLAQKIAAKAQGKFANFFKKKK